jgi:hypothetical protein
MLLSKATAAYPSRDQTRAGRVIKEAAAFAAGTLKLMRIRPSGVAFALRLVGEATDLVGGAAGRGK